MTRTEKAPEPVLSHVTATVDLERRLAPCIGDPVTSGTGANEPVTTAQPRPPAAGEQVRSTLRRPQARIAGDLPPPQRPLSARMFLGRSLFPLLALVVIAGTAVWGPWITLGLALLSWNLVGRLG